MGVNFDFKELLSFNPLTGNRLAESYPELFRESVDVIVSIPLRGIG